MLGEDEPRGSALEHVAVALQRLEEPWAGEYGNGEMGVLEVDPEVVRHGEAEVREGEHQRQEGERGEREEEREGAGCCL